MELVRLYKQKPSSSLKVMVRQMRYSNKTFAEREHERMVRAIRRNGYKMTPGERRELVKTLRNTNVGGWIICRQGRRHRQVYRNGPNPVARAWGAPGGIQIRFDIVEDEGRCYLGCRVADSPFELNRILNR